MYNPKNAAAMLKSMKNKNQTREDKILARHTIQPTTSTKISLDFWDYMVYNPR